MDNLISSSSPASFPAGITAEAPAGCTLIVLMAAREPDPAAAARRVRELADLMKARILFVGLYRNATQEPAILREMVEMSALASSGRDYAEIRTVAADAWSGMIQSSWRPGDVVVYFQEHKAGRLRRPASAILPANPGIPLYILTSVDTQTGRVPNRSAQITAWIGSIGIISVFFLLQVQIGNLTGAWAHIPLLLLSILVEAWILWVWNNLFD